ncbi:FAD-dependent oxidoreductase [Conexibacter woesei]|uniref:FAD-dependent oxidoreductase n=1 Tax=Conexibacter woesei TaxID=191495 RepID=UPI000412529C|nr:FAD-dependent oxidoreductase [Conexibacter woesei]
MPSEGRTLPDPLRVVIAGGGVAALEALAALGAVVPCRVTPVLITKTINFRYRPLLLGEPFGHGAPRAYPLDGIAADHGAELIADDVVEVMPDMHAVRTAGDALVPYDVLIVATGARAYPAFQDGIAFDRETSPEDFDEALADLGAGLAPHVAIVVPDGVTWTLPAYQLALQIAAWGRSHHASASVVTLLTPERKPLEAFGETVSLEVADLLEAERIVVRTGVHPDVVTATALRAGGRWLGADRIVALPLLQGPRLLGLPHDAHGFLDTTNIPDVHVAGDAGCATAIKQGGLAAQQADAVVARIARRCGAPAPAHDPEPMVLRGILDTRSGPRFLRAALDDPDATSTFSPEPLWWPPTAVATRRLAPYLAGLEVTARV